MKLQMAPVVFCSLLCACSSQALYETGRNAQRNECMKIMDPSERDRCLADASTPYDTYKRETGTPARKEAY